MRLDKYLCESTELTRSEARRLIRKGFVRVDGQTCKNAAEPVRPGHTIMLDEEILTPRGLRYLMLHKPEGFICAAEGGEYPSALSLLDIDKPEILHFAGRLDADTTGLVLITDDGQWSHRITAPRQGCEKHYVAELVEPPQAAWVDLFQQGLQLHGEDSLTLPAQLELPNEGAPETAARTVGLVIQEGRYHQVKRMFAAVGNRVARLHRDRIGPIRLDPELAPGEWRPLTDEEIDAFR